MDIEDAGTTVRYLIRDRDGKYPPGFNAILNDADVHVVLSGVRMPRMNSVTERWILTCRGELLDRVLVWNTRHLLQVLREFESHHNTHRPPPGVGAGRTAARRPGIHHRPDKIADLNIRRHDLLGGTLHEYQHAA
jgi:putative transposase